MKKLKIFSERLSKWKLSFGPDKYYRMSNVQLENEAAKFHIQEYGYNTGHISRERIISQLLQKDGANNAHLAKWISVIALILSIISICFNLFSKD